eukprot:2838417-Alexandrium_andersonii.AAC.1
MVAHGQTHLGNTRAEPCLHAPKCYPNARAIATTCAVARNCVCTCARARAGTAARKIARA